MDHICSDGYVWDEEKRVWTDCPICKSDKQIAELFKSEPESFANTLALCRHPERRCTMVCVDCSFTFQMENL